MTSVPQPETGILDGPLHRFAVHVYFEDTDAGGVVYHANYLRWFERARTDILRLLGIDQRAAMDAGTGSWVVKDVYLDYRAPARLGDTVLIETRTEQARRASMRMHQRALVGDAVVCEGRLRLGFVGPDGRPRRQPDEWMRLFNPFVVSPAES